MDLGEPSGFPLDHWQKSRYAGARNVLCVSTVTVVHSMRAPMRVIMHNSPPYRKRVSFRCSAEDGASFCILIHCALIEGAASLVRAQSLRIMMQ
jgi:hypothetical protein